MWKKFTFTKKRSASFKDQRTSNDIDQNGQCVSTHLPVQRSLSLQMPSSTSNTFNSSISIQQDDETSRGITAQSTIRTTSIETFVAHSQNVVSPVSTAECLFNNLNALTTETWLSDNCSMMSLGSFSSSDISSKNNTSSKNIPNLLNPNNSSTAEIPHTGIPTLESSADAFESYDILEEALKTFRLLSVDISRSLDTIPNSPALPSVIEKYSRPQTVTPEHQNSNTPSQQNLNNGNTTPKWKDSLPSVQEEYLEILAAFQLRCLEYREMMRDYAESILAADCRCFTELSVSRIVDFNDGINGLRDNFSNFKAMCEKQLRNVENKGLPCDVFSIFMQTTFLYTLEHQNDSYLTRLQSGVDLLRAHCKFVRYQNKARRKVIALKSEIYTIRRTSVGFSV